MSGGAIAYFISGLLPEINSISHVIVVDSLPFVIYLQPGILHLQYFFSFNLVFIDHLFST